MQINYPPNKESVIKTIKCMETLYKSVDAAGGKHFSSKELDEMSVMDFILNVAGPNDIIFQYLKGTNND